MHRSAELEARLFGHLLFTIDGDYRDFVKFCNQYSHIFFSSDIVSHSVNVHVHFQENIELHSTAVIMDEGSYYTPEGAYYEIKPNYAFCVNILSEKLILIMDSKCENELAFHIIFIFVRLFSKLLFLHGSGAEINGKKIIFPAWGGAGKTNLMIALLGTGSRYIADDIVVVEPDSNRVLPFQKSLSLLDYNFVDNRKLVCHLDSRKRMMFYAWILLQRSIGFPSLLKLPLILKVIKYIGTPLRQRVGCSLDARLISTMPIVGNPGTISEVLYLQRINNGSFIRIESFAKTGFVQKMKLCLDRERSEMTKVINRFSYASEEFRNVNKNLNAAECGKLETFAGKNNIQKLQYGLNVQSMTIARYLTRRDA